MGWEETVIDWTKLNKKNGIYTTEELLAIQAKKSYQAGVKAERERMFTEIKRHFKERGYRDMEELNWCENLKKKEGAE